MRGLGHLIRVRLTIRIERYPVIFGIAGERLRSFIDRIERLEEEKAALAADIQSSTDYIINDKRHWLVGGDARNLVGVLWLRWRWGWGNKTKVPCRPAPSPARRHC